MIKKACCVSAIRRIDKNGVEICSNIFVGTKNLSSCQIKMLTKFLSNQLIKHCNVGPCVWLEWSSFNHFCAPLWGKGRSHCQQESFWQLTASQSQESVGKFSVVTMKWMWQIHIHSSCSPWHHISSGQKSNASGSGGWCPFCKWGWNSWSYSSRNTNANNNTRGIGIRHSKRSRRRWQWSGSSPIVGKCLCMKQSIYSKMSTFYGEMLIYQMLWSCEHWALRLMTGTHSQRIQEIWGEYIVQLRQWKIVFILLNAHACFLLKDCDWVIHINDLWNIWRDRQIGDI